MIYSQLSTADLQHLQRLAYLNDWAEVQLDCRDELQRRALARGGRSR